MLNSNSATEPVRVVVNGRVNSGKTTLVRTLLRRAVGEVADGANATTIATPYVDDALGMILVDAPGFEDVGTYHAWQLLRTCDPHMAERLRGDSDLSLEAAAMDAAAECDLSLYVASAETVPTRATLQEVQLLRECGAVVGVLNKGQLARRALGDQGAAERAAVWGRFFTHAGICWIEYDAHLSSPATLSQLYRLMGESLADERARVFHAYVTAREQRAQQQRAEVARAFAREVTALRGAELSAVVPAGEYSVQRGEEVALDTLRATVRDRLARFDAACTTVYGYSHAIDHPVLDLKAEVTQAYTPGSVSYAVTGAVVGAYGGAAIASPLLGALFAAVGLIFGNAPGAAAGFKLGSTVGATLGGGAGAILGGVAGRTGDSEAKVTVDEPLLRTFAELATTRAAALAYHGFGRGEVVDLRSTAQVRGDTTAAIRRAPTIQMSSASADVLSDWMQRVLRDLGI